MADKNSRSDAEHEHEQQIRRVWVTPAVIVASAQYDTNHAANTVSDGTGNLFS